MKKKKSKLPPLSKKDKNIYKLLFILSFVLSGIAILVSNAYFRRVQFEDPRVVAQHNYGTLFLMFLYFIAGMGFAAFFDRLKNKKQPIFGNPEVNYTAFQKPLYPIFSKKFWKALFLNKKKLSTFVICTLLVTFSLSLATSLNLKPRECLYDNGSISTYNSFDEAKKQYTVEDATEAKIYIHKQRAGKRRYKRSVQMQISMYDGKTFSFSYIDFRTIEDIDLAKKLFDPKIIVIEDQEHIERAIRDMELDAEEAEWIYKIFKTTPPT